MVLVLLICASWLFTIKHTRASNITYFEIELRNGNQWTLREEHGNKHNAQLMPSTVSTPSIVFLHLNLGSVGKRYLMIRRSQLEQEAFRQLRVALKLSSSTT